jgi:hypothetical protein
LPAAEAWMDDLLAPTTMPSNHNFLVLIINIVVVKAELTKREGTVYVSSVMNSICIHLRDKSSYIYMYRRGEYTKNPWRNIIIERLIHI